MNHSGDTNKMVDTPRTTDRVVFIDGNPWVNAPFARELERELNEANDRIKRLEEAVDAAISFCEFHGPVGATPDTARLIAKNLRKSKEAKP